jgi:hypothetical protein
VYLFLSCLKEYPMKPGDRVRGLERWREARDNAEEAEEGGGASKGASSMGISPTSRTSDGGGGESDEMVELSILKTITNSVVQIGQKQRCAS